jgi:ornithine carbamoyltransferase
MSVRHLLSLLEVGPENLSAIIDDALAISRCKGGRKKNLYDKIVGLYFKRPSTRTRTSFTAAALKLGARVIAYGPNDLQLTTGETAADTARVLSNYVDALIVRTNESIEEMRSFALQDEMAVINAMSENEHPTQAIADLVTIKEALSRLNDVHVLYLGEGNNSAVALALAAAMTPGMCLTLVTPEEYGLPTGVLETAKRLTKASGSLIEQIHGMEALPKSVDAVYTTRWQTMGEPKSDPDWRQKFIPYRVTPDVMKRVSKPKGTIFLHDLPAIRGAEVADEVLDGPQSLVFRQAWHKQNTAMAVLRWCLAER